MAFTIGAPTQANQVLGDVTNIRDNFTALRNLETGGSAPANPVAGMFWYDTGNSLVKQRNAANNAWIPKWGIDVPYLGQMIKGSDLASASTLPVTSAANYWDVTGNVTINAIASISATGALIKLHFDAILQLTHHATDLILPGGANITTVAGDEVEFFEYATGKWLCTNYQSNAKDSIFGAEEGTYSNAINYQAATDLLVRARRANSAGYVVGYTGTANPATIIAQTSDSSSGDGISFLVRKGDWFKVNVTAGSATTIKTIPISIVAKLT